MILFYYVLLFKICQRTALMNDWWVCKLFTIQVLTVDNVELCPFKVVIDQIYFLVIWRKKWRKLKFVLFILPLPSFNDLLQRAWITLFYIHPLSVNWPACYWYAYINIHKTKPLTQCNLWSSDCRGMKTFVSSQISILEQGSCDG